MKVRFVAHIMLFVLLVATLAGCAKQEDTNLRPKAAVTGSRVVVDMAGRSVVLPPKVQKAFATSPVGSILVYTIAPELLAGWNYRMATDETKFILPQCRKLPVIGGGVGKDSTINVEEIVKLKPDVIIVMTWKEIAPADVDSAEQLQEVMKIPVVLIDGSISKMEQAYLFAGKVLGREERTAELAAYCRDTLNTAGEKKTLLAGRKPVTVYYAEGRRGLETEPKGSAHAEIIEFVGGTNVAGLGVPGGGNFGRSPVSLEQVLLWDPEVILIGYFRDGESSSFPQIMEDREWKDIRAIRDRRVYEIPNHPFNWFDRPPAVNRLIGIKWVANLLYPDIYSFDARKEVQRFYSLFYHYQLSEQETDELLQRTQ